MQNVSVFISEDLHLDVLRPADVAFEKDGIITEGGSCFVTSFLQAAFEILRTVDDTHAPSTAAKGRFDNERETDASRGLNRDCRVRDGLGCSGNCGDARLISESTGGRFIAKKV